MIFKFCFKVLPFALISEVFLGIDIYLGGNNVELAVETNFHFFDLSVQKNSFVNPKNYKNICLQSNRKNKNI